MCGLYASVGLTPEPERIDIVAHRGPDGRGWWEGKSPVGPVVLGHRRLKIIDLTNDGQQPMLDPSERYRLIFNGEIYNYVELREELQAKGEIFRTASDSEVLLRAFTFWGEDCLHRLRGMFAFVIYDSKTQRLFAARDRFGIKPLYLAMTARSMALGSEIKQLIGLPGVSGRMNIPRVHDFLSSGMSDHTSETMFEGIRQLMGGECLLVDAGSTALTSSIRTWYRPETFSLHISENEAAEQFRHLLEESIRLHLRSDVPVGSCLSGGLDSSALVCLMADSPHAGLEQHTVSACYADKSVDEKPFMDAVVAQTGVTPHFIYPRAEDIFEKASAITWHQDEPFGSTSIFAQWCVFEEAGRAGLKVMLDGQGADEQLAGYHFAFPYYLAHLLRSGQFLTALKTIQNRHQKHGASYSDQMMRTLSALLPGPVAQALRRQREAAMGNDWLGSVLLRLSGNPAGALQAAVTAHGLALPRDIDSLCRVMMQASNLPMLLHWEDRNAMAHGIEARVPFLDHPLVEFSLSLGNHHKMAGHETKRVLRQAMAQVLPLQVAQRQDKLGFATPEQAWFRGPLRGLLHDSVEATLSRYPELLNSAGTRAMRDAMLSGERPTDHALWRIVSLGLWGERFGVGL